MIVKEQKLYDGSNYLGLRLSDTFKVVDWTQLAQNASLTIWTPTTGSKINLQGIKIKSLTNAAVFELYQGSTLIVRLNTENAEIEIILPQNGIPFTNVDDALILKNIQAAAIYYDVFAWGFET